MEYREFMEQVKSRIQDYLPEKFADAHVEITEVVKNNDCILDALMIKTEESNISPTIYLDSYYNQMEDGSRLEDILARIAEVYQSHYISHDVDISEIMDYEKIKERIGCKLINREENARFLQDKPYMPMEDLAVVYQVVMDKTLEETATVTINNKLMDGYGISAEALHEQAIKNMDFLQPPCFKGMKEVMAEMMVEDIAWQQGISMEEAKKIALDNFSEMPETMYVLTNEMKVNGASAILNDDIRQKIAREVGDFFVLPSSLHETLIIPKSSGMTVKDLEKMVREVNQTQVTPEEKLSDHVYEYDAKTHELFRSDKALERATEKTQKADRSGERVSIKQKLSEKKSAVAALNVGKEISLPGKKKEAAITV